MERIKGKFSIILPYYNGKKYIHETVGSVLAQTYSNFELLLIDDGSPDKAASDFLVSLVASSKDKRVKYHHKNNGGLSDARNFGVEMSEGEFIAFIDQDDLWDSQKLDLQAEVFSRDVSVNFICSDAKIIGEKAEEMRIGPKWGFKDGIIENTFGKLIRGNFVACSSVAFRRSVLDSVGYSNRAYSVVPDYEYFLRFSEKMNFYFISRSLLSYRLHEGNTTKQLVRGECEVVSVLFDRKPRNASDKFSLSVNLSRHLLMLLWLWLKKII